CPHAGCSHWSPPPAYRTRPGYGYISACRRASGIRTPPPSQRVRLSPWPNLLCARCTASSTALPICSCTAPSFAQPVPSFVTLPTEYRQLSIWGGFRAAALIRPDDHRSCDPCGTTGGRQPPAVMAILGPSTFIRDQLGMTARSVRQHTNTNGPDDQENP